MELSSVERLALAQALYKAAGELVDTKNPDSLRSEVDRRYKELYEQTGSKSFDVMIRGEQVGTYSIRFSKPKEQETKEVFEVFDYVELAKWFEDVPADEVRRYVASDLAQFAKWHAEETGELADGCTFEAVIVPAAEKSYMGGVLKVDVGAVAKAMGNQLAPGIVGLLEG